MANEAANAAADQVPQETSDAVPEEAVDASADSSLPRAIKPYGGRLEQLADGSTIVVLEGDRQVATDQAAQAARCALAMRVVAGNRPLAIAMGPRGIDGARSSEAT